RVRVDDAARDGPGSQLEFFVWRDLDDPESELSDPIRQSGHARNQHRAIAGEGAERAGMEVIVMGVRDIDVVEMLTIEQVGTRLGVVPPLSPKAGTTPPGIREDGEPAGLDQEGCMSDQGDLHGSAVPTWRRGRDSR